MYVKHKFDICNGKKLVNNYMFKIDVKNTRTRCELCLKITIKTLKLFFFSWLWTCICLLSSYLHFYCLNDFHYLDYFHCLHDLRKNWNLVHILKLAEGWATYWFSYAMRHNDARKWGDITYDVLKLLFMYYNFLLL